VASPPDASKVRVSGPGVQDGVLAVYESKFKADTAGAGGGELTVNIHGPKGLHLFARPKRFAIYVQVLVEDCNNQLSESNYRFHFNLK